MVGMGAEVGKIDKDHQLHNEYAPYHNLCANRF